jgi:hypothetical protein
MLSTEDPALVCLMCTGEDEAAYKAWIGSPVRNKQTEDLATMLADVNVSMANSCFKQLPATETDRDNAFPIGSYRAR